MNIVVFNQRWFVDEWRALGHNVLSCGLSKEFDIYTTPFIHIDSILEALSFTPDYLVFFDDSAPISIAGLDTVQIPTLFYSVDTHHHWEQHLYLGLLFDKILTAQKDYLHCFTDRGIDAEWLPLWASRYYESSDDKRYGACFVGTMDPKLNPERVRFFQALEKQGLVQCMRGEYWKFFPHAEMVVNQTVKSDLNFRVFESMMSGAMLLTEHSENGLLELFENGEHLVTYRKGDVEQVSRLIRHYLAYPEECRRIGANGRLEIMRRHTPQHRAEKLLDILRSLSKKRESRRHLSALITFSKIGMQLSRRDRDLQLEPFRLALNSLEKAVELDNDLVVEDEDEATYLIWAAFGFDSLSRSRRGGDLLKRAAERWPNLKVLELAKIKILLDQGEIAEAERLVGSTSNESPDVIFAKIEKFVAHQLQIVFGEN